MSTGTQDTQNWPELGIALYDKLTGRDAEITYDFENFEVMVPSAARENAARAPWKVNGMVKIRTHNPGERT